MGSTTARVPPFLDWQKTESPSRRSCTASPNARRQLITDAPTLRQSQNCTKHTEFERELIRARTGEGRKRAKDRD
jgi:hypothetical protein